MRAVALSDVEVQRRIARDFIPLEVRILPGSEEFPLSWPALRGWAMVYSIGGGPNNRGLTGCTIVSPDGRVEYANTGSAMVWELFESTAYDAKRFTAMLDRGRLRFARERDIRNDANVPAANRVREVRRYREEVRALVAQEGRMRLPPSGFRLESAMELFRKSGDLGRGR